MTDTDPMRLRHISVIRLGFNGSNVAWFASLVRGLGTANMYSVSSVDQNNLQRVCHEMYGRWLVPLVPDVDECDYFLLVGMNPAVSTFGWIHNVPDGWRRTTRAARSRREDCARRPESH